MNKKFGSVLTIALGLFFLSPRSQLAHAEMDHAQSVDNRLGLGAILGVPTGLSAKYRINRKAALDFGLAFSFNNYIEFFSDYLFQFPGAFHDGSAAAAEFTPYVGIGAAIFSNTAGSRGSDSYYFSSCRDSIALGMRIPLGVEWLPRSTPLGVFAEMVPGVGIVPGTFGFFEGDLGVRYYF